MNVIKKTFQYGAHQVTLETGRFARQATGSVLISMDDTVLLVTVVAKKEGEIGRDFLPLTVNYQEKTYAAGKIPGGFLKREGRPSERETLISRLIDRPIRPLFPKGFSNEVQVIATVLSVDPKADSDIPAIIGTAAAIGLSGVPFNGPVAAARVAFREGQYLLNPSQTEMENSQLDLVVAGTANAVLMVESEADQLTEEQMLGAVLFGHEQMQVAIKAIEEFVQEAGKERWEWEVATNNHELQESISTLAEKSVHEAYQIHDKQQRQTRLNEILTHVIEKHGTPEELEMGGPTQAEIGAVFHDLEKRIVRTQILEGEPRIDGRDTVTVRPIDIEVGVVPRAHGSALFTRGETQALVVATLGTERDAQMVDDLGGARTEDFMLHYNFPPFCVGEVGFMAGPKRREIGHGKLAKRALENIIPGKEAFPYVIRVVSEITESNGSSSMASVCGSSLALMDAGVPIKDAIAGIAMGLIKEGNRYAILTDILGDEDHLGDMDFKVAGSEKGVTALQMDIKIDGITKEIMERALDQARDARLHILGKMKEAIQAPRESVSDYAPRIISFKINPEKIKDVIGKGGSVIRELIESTSTTIDISDDGVVKIAAVDVENGEEAKRRIELLTAEAEVGKTYEGPVVKIMDFGAFVSILPGRQGLVHISQISTERVENIHNYLKEGQIVRVKVTEIDRQGRIRLSMKEAE